MQPTSPIEIAIILFIVIGIVVAIFKVGRANPQDTGTLAGSIETIKREVRDVESRVGHIEQSVRGMATKADIERVEAKIDGHRELADRTASGVKRLEDFFLDRGIKGK